MIYTGLTFLIPRGLYGETKGKSGVTLAGGLVLPGVIDRGFTGEIKVQMANISKIQTLCFFPGERIAQIVFMPYWSGKLNEIYNLLPTPTKGGSNGFRSTGRLANRVK